MTTLRLLVALAAMSPLCGCIMVVGHTPDGAAKMLQCKTAWKSGDSCGCEACGCESCQVRPQPDSIQYVPPTPAPSFPAQTAPGVPPQQ